MLVRKHPTKKNCPQIVILDHGLYRDFNDEFRLSYNRLWRGLIMSDELAIKKECMLMNSGPAYALLAAMLTMKPWDDIIGEKLIKKSKSNISSKGDAVMLRGYAKRYFGHILKLLGTMPSDLLLVLKTNDCLRHLDRKLGTPVKSMTGM